MNTEVICKKCGQPIKVGSLVCNCGAVVAPADIEMPAVDIRVASDFMAVGKDVTIPNLGTAFDYTNAVPELEKIALDAYVSDVTSDRVASSDHYRPVLAIGRTENDELLLENPICLFRTQDGILYVLDSAINEGVMKMQLYDSDGNLVQQIPELATGADYGGLDIPTRIAVDSEQNIFIADMGSCCIWHVGPTGEIVGALGIEGTANRELMAPMGLSVDPNDCLYIADTDNNRVLKWNRHGDCLLVLGINRLEEGQDWLMAGEGTGEFDAPHSVAVNSVGEIFVADTYNHRVQKFSSTGVLLQTFGKEGESAEAFSFPSCVQVDNASNIYVMDSNGRRIQKFGTDGEFVYQIILPVDVGPAADFAVDAQGQLYVPLSDAQIVLKLEVD